MSELKQRLSSTSIHQPSPKSDSDSDSDSKHHPTTVPTSIPNERRPLQQQPSMAQRALASTAYLANLLPTGTLLAFQLLTPIFTNNGQCDIATRAMTSLLLTLLALSCFLASFTDSFRAQDGQVYYGFATLKGMWLINYPGPVVIVDLAKYKMRFIDWVHAILSVLVFGVVALRDKNIVNCFYPKPSHEVREVLDVLPLGVGLICSLLFVAFPTTRHGIGYPVTNGSQSQLISS